MLAIVPINMSVVFFKSIAVEFVVKPTVPSYVEQMLPPKWTADHCSGLANLFSNAYVHSKKKPYIKVLMLQLRQCF